MAAQNSLIPRTMARYGFAVLVSGAALLAGAGLTRTVGPGLPPYFTFYPAVMLVAAVWGGGAGLVATAASAFMASYWLLPPGRQLAIANPVDAASLTLFLLLGGGVSWIAELYHRTRARATTYARELAQQAEQVRAASEIARQQAEAAIGQRERQLAAFREVSTELTRELDLPRLLRLIVVQAAAIASVPIARLFLLEEAGQLLRCKAGVGFPPEIAQDLTIPVGVSLSGHVAVTGEPLAVADTRGDSRSYYPAHVDKYGVVSYLGLPVKFQERLFGVLVFNTPAPRAYAPEEIAYLTAFAQQAAVAIQNVRLYEAAQQEIGERRQADASLKQRTRHIETLRSIGEEIARELDLPRVLDLIIHRAVELVGASSGILRLWEDEHQLLATRAWTGIPSQVPTVSLRLGEGISGEAARRRRGLYANDFRTGPYASPALLEGSVHTAVMAVPLLYRERLVGVLAITRNATDPPFTETELQVLNLFAPQTAIAIENARLYEAAQRELAERAQAEEALAARTMQLEAIRAVTNEITQELDLERVLTLIAQQAVALVGADADSLWLWDAASQTLRAESWHGHGDWMAGRRLRPGEGLAGTVVQQRMGMIENAYRTSAHAHPVTLAHSTITASLAEPLLFRDRFLVVLVLDRMAGRPPFQPADQTLLRLFAAQAAIAIENARLFAELNDSYAQLQTTQAEMVRAEKLRALGQMAAGVAHDLNNMLAAILGQAELLRLRVKLPEVQEALQVLYTAASDGAQVVRRLQEFGRQQPTTPLFPCALAPIVQEALELTRSRWQDEAQRQGRAIEIHTTLDGLPRILGQPAELREALTNLLLNAVDAMPTGGTLTLAGYCEPTPEAPTVVVLTVTDTGTGMPEEVLRHIFDPFYTTKGARGTGLGLAVVYGILERHGGRIAVASTPGRGTIFTLRFQAAAGGPDTAPSPAPSQLHAPRRILLIDDEAPVRTTLAALLRAVGHDVIEAENGAAGLAALAAQAVDLVLTDLGMPEMTGWEVAQRVKAARPSLPVILLTGWGQQISHTTPGQEYVDRVLGKPARLDKLQATIAELTAPGDLTAQTPETDPSASED
jgi:signal transduction histidine kinase/CheY-like chemotaxis protein